MGAPRHEPVIIEFGMSRETVKSPEISVKISLRFVVGLADERQLLLVDDVEA